MDKAIDILLKLEKIVYKFCTDSNEMVSHKAKSKRFKSTIFMDRSCEQTKFIRLCKIYLFSVLENMSTIFKKDLSFPKNRKLKLKKHGILFW